MVQMLSVNPIQNLSQTAYDLFKNENSVDISYVMQGKGDDNGDKAEYLIQNICEVRKDCIALVSPSYNDVVNKSGEETKNVIEYRDFLARVVLITTWILDTNNNMTDIMTDMFGVPLNGDVAGIMARSDNNNDPWVVSSGYQKRSG